MTHTDFDHVRRMLGVNRQNFAKTLGINMKTEWRYRTGRQKIPLHIALACSALVHRLPPYGDTHADESCHPHTDN